jgi:HD-GYP domain-containing protein (c-di-GMP phosphodiesterase class II)
LSHADACKELEDNAGTQFDPEVVEALLAVLARANAATGSSGEELDHTADDQQYT